MKKLVTLLFICMCLAQWLVLANMIYKEEKTRLEGRIFKFQTAPVDPSDPFRGKYVTLDFKEDNILVSDPKVWERQTDVYVTLADSSGFASIKTVSVDTPEGNDFIKAKIDYVENYGDGPYRLWVQYPFERFYLEESKAAKAERIYWQSRADSSSTTYAVVSVMQGKASLLDVMVNDSSIVDIVRNLNTH